MAESTAPPPKSGGSGPIIIAAVTLVCGILFLPETRGRPVQM